MTSSTSRQTAIPTPRRPADLSPDWWLRLAPAERGWRHERRGDRHSCPGGADCTCAHQPVRKFASAQIMRLVQRDHPRLRGEVVRR